MIRSCDGPKGEPGVCWEDEQGRRLTCHIVDMSLPEAEQIKAKAAAMRSAMRDGAALVSGGDPRMMRDG